MTLFPAKVDGTVVIEMDMEIADSPTRSHRCQFYVTTTLYHLEQFKKNLPVLCKKYEFAEIVLHS